ncbi:MAG: hypothetical protein ACFFB3_14150, partial [Candidatus Hodarchaeota archaeon]
MTRAVELGARTTPGTIQSSVSAPRISRPRTTILTSETDKWFRSYPEYLTKEIKRDTSRYIDKLIKVPGLTSAVLLDFLSHVDVRGYNVGHELRDILTSLAVTHPEAIRALYDALVSCEDSGKSAMLMRLMVQKGSVFDLVFCKTTVPTEISGTIDLWGVSPSGDIAWFAVLPGSVEENAAQGLINELMSINPFYYAN